MIFTEFRFFIFLVVLLAIYWSLPAGRLRKVLLVLGSYVFYGAWDWRFLSLIVFSTTIDYLVARRLGTTDDQSARKRLLLTSLVANLGMLGLFKYFNFFADSLVDFAAVFGAEINHTTLNIVLPVGISFYTFQTLSYTIDVYRRRLQPEQSYLDVALFVAFFPQLVAGPIVRALDFLPQLHRVHRFAEVPLRACLVLFVIGYIKKAGISDNLAFYIDAIYAAPELYTAGTVITGTLLYAIQIYCDFSGYSDMAIATAGLFGYQLPKNFEAPYLSTSIIDFWRRWHISLSTWLRDYLYVSLGGNRYGELMRYRNLLLTMILGGLWHGAAWTFVIWGLLHGLLLALNHLWRDVIAPGRRFAIPGILAWLITLYLVNLLWIFFRAPDMETAWRILGAYVLYRSSGTEQFPVLLTVLPVLLLLIHAVHRRYALDVRLSGLPAVPFTLALALIWVVAIAATATTYQPFIYFQF